MPTFSSAPAAVAYDKAATQPLGALSAGMGYDPTVATTATEEATYIGGAAQTIGYGRDLDAAVAVQEDAKPKAKK